MIDEKEIDKNQVKDEKKEIGDLKKIFLGNSINEKTSNNLTKHIYLGPNIRKQNLMIIGLKGTLKTTKILPSLFIQDLNSSVSTICLVKDENQAQELLMYHRSIRKKKSWFYLDDIKDINLMDNIKPYSTTIITGNMLKEIENQNFEHINLDDFINNILDCDVSIYIDDAKMLLQFIEKLINKQNNQINLTLFFQSRNDFIDYNDVINNNVLNTMLLNILNREDNSYYEQYIHYKDNFIDYNFIKEKHIELYNITNSIYKLPELDEDDVEYQRNLEIKNQLQIKRDNLIKSLKKYDENNYTIFSRRKHFNVLEYSLEDGTRYLSLINYYNVLDYLNIINDKAMKDRVRKFKNDLKKKREIDIGNKINEKDEEDSKKIVEKTMNNIIKDNVQHFNVIF